MWRVHSAVVPQPKNIFTQRRIKEAKAQSLIRPGSCFFLHCQFGGLGVLAVEFLTQARIPETWVVLVS
jgi:hypothetical protein